MASCIKDHAGSVPASALAELPFSQAGAGRHRCAGCAYERGRAGAAEAEQRLRERVRALEARIAELEAAK